VKCQHQVSDLHHAGRQGRGAGRTGLLAVLLLAKASVASPQHTPIASRGLSVALQKTKCEPASTPDRTCRDCQRLFAVTEAPPQCVFAGARRPCTFWHAKAERRKQPCRRWAFITAAAPATPRPAACTRCCWQAGTRLPMSYPVHASRPKLL